MQSCLTFLPKCMSRDTLDTEEYHHERLNEFTPDKQLMIILDFCIFKKLHLSTVQYIFLLSHTDRPAEGEEWI